MSDPVDLLRFALAAICTELEKDNPSLEDCQQIADEALALTADCGIPRSGKRVDLDGQGLESWRQYLAIERRVPERAEGVVGRG